MPSPLCRRLTVRSAAENVSMPDRVGERAGVERPQVGDAVDQVEDGRCGRVVVADDEHVARERLVEVGERGRRDEVERGDDLAAGATACTSAAIEPAGGSTGTNWRPSFSRPLAIEITTLPASCVGVGAWRWPPRRPRPWPARRARRRRRRGWCRARGPSTRSPQRSRSSSTTCCGPIALPRPDHDLVARRSPSRAAMPRPAGPVPPNTPICMRAELRTARPDPEHPAVVRRHSAVSTDG